MSALAESTTVLERLGLNTIAAETVSADQEQTAGTFGYKWARRETYEEKAVIDATRTWLLEKYCGGDANVLRGWLAGGRKTIVDAGCGAGVSGLILFEEYLQDHDYVGIDISSSVDVARTRFAEAGAPAHFVRANLATVPLTPESVDLVYSEGVLHHTDNPAASLAHLAKALVPGGRAAFYVYAKKAAIREFTDDHIRQSLRPLNDEDAWNALEPLTRLGQALGELNVNLTVPMDVPQLGIKAGTYDLQRFFYWNICKAFYRPEYSHEAMLHVNFDWFRPENCFRQTPDDVRQWCEAAGLEVERMHVEDAGITVVAQKRARNE